MSTLGKGRKSAKRYLVEGNENIERGGDRLAKVSFDIQQSSKYTLPGWKLRISLQKIVERLCI